jgi:hypothetical protein
MAIPGNTRSPLSSGVGRDVYGGCLGEEPDACGVDEAAMALATRAASAVEKGLFVNRNSPCKLRNRFTLDRLHEVFGLDAEG